MSMAKRLNKLIDTGSDIIANKVMLQPSIDAGKGKLADKKRTNIIRARESRVNDKKMGY